MTNDNVKWLAGEETASGEPTPSHDPVVVRLEAEVERLKGELQKHISLRESLDKLYSIANLTKEVARLRGLLREACEYEVWVSHGEREYAMSADWRNRAQAALEAKP